MPSPSAIHHILVLDDDQVMRDLVEALLSLQGYHVTVTGSGEQALIALRANRGFDLVLTDLHMPGLEGEALTRALRSLMPSRALLIGMSASEAAAEVIPHLDAFLLKPFHLQVLQQAVETAGQNRAAQDPVVPPRAGPNADITEAPPTEILDEKIFQSLLRLVPPPQLRQLYEMTLGDVEKRHARIETSAAADDLASVQREAHAIKGSCGMVGAAELQRLAASLEGGTTLNTFALIEIPAACLRLRRMLDVKLQTV